MSQSVMHRCWEWFFLCLINFNVFVMNEINVNPTRLQVRQQAAAPIIDLKQLWSLAVINWRWFVVSFALCGLLALAFVWFMPKTYTVSGKMEIKDKSKSGRGMSAGLAMLNSLPMGLGSSLGGSLGAGLALDSETEILKSNSLVHRVVKDLGLYTEYRHCKWGRKRLLYKDEPIHVSLDQTHVDWFDNELPLTVHQIKLVITKDNDGYTIETTLKENKDKTSLPDQTFTTLPATVKTEVGVITITENKLLTEKQKEPFEDGYSLRVDIKAPMEAAQDMLEELNIAAPSKKVLNMLNINIVDENILRGVDFINHLVEAYNQRANDEKNEEAMKMDEFVNGRLTKLDAELGSSDADWEKYKKQFQVTDPSVDAEEVMTKKSEYETQLVNHGIQLQLHDYLSEYINNPDNLLEFIPLSIGSGGAVALQDASIISKHNALVSQRKEMLKSMSEKAPQVEQITQTIKELHPDIIIAMKRDRQSLLMKRSNLEREYNHYMSRVGNAPQQERVLTEIGRQREIKQGVYLLMLQKREEVAMELANVSDDGKLVDGPLYVRNSKKPQMKMVAISVVFLGLFLPFVIFCIILLCRKTVGTRKDISNLSSCPLIGELPFSASDDAIRDLRTNLLLNLEEGQKVILMVSHDKGDGKTYIAKLLADSLSAIGKKVLYMDLDLRSRTVDGHPADILAGHDFAEQMAKAKADNDYVIVDTSELSRYPDAYQVACFADATCYVVNRDHTALSVLEQLKSEKRLPNIRFILNANTMVKKSQLCFKHAMSLIAAVLMLSACGSKEKIVYLENANQMNLELSKPLFDARIMPKDILTITVSTINKAASEPFNLTVLTTGASTSLTTQPALKTYLVANDGSIDFPVLGRVNVGGLTKKECEDMILEKIRPYLSETEKPIVTVRMSSYSISVLGEVAKPGSFQVSREKINIFEALAQAGDMTIYGVRDRVRLIREDSTGKKEIHMLDLTDANIINSPYYYLQQNDIVYVEPSNIKKQDSRVGSMTNLWFSATSILVSLASIIITIVK